ncbi:xanthine dehydrogenase family protein molybdopterin-binding subunit [Skermanella stibiiresistens]|nr:molybdopterin cofactor-binding domain-containing protein [Skermanella stibiiresistens]
MTHQFTGQRVIIQNVSRRGFLKGAGTAVGLVVALQFIPLREARAAVGYATGAGEMPHGTVNDPHVFITIDPSGTVTIVTHRSEMGTGIRTSMPMVVADEMEADWSRVRITQAPADEPRYGNQDTDGSRSMRHFIQPMRQCGAAMRQMLETAAAKQWSVPVGEVQARNHEVVHQSSGRKLGYGDLAKAAMDVPVPPVEQLTLKKDADFRYMGKGIVQITDLHDITTGKAVYGQDVTRPGMKFAVVARPPVVGGRVKSFDPSETLKVPGVERIVEIPTQESRIKYMPLGGIAVVASNTHAAIRGREALKIEWEDGPNASYDSAAYKAKMEETGRTAAKVVRNEGDPEKAFASAARKVSAEYYVPHLACAPMEPMVATAEMVNGACEVWAPLQYPYGCREDLAKMLDLPIEKVTVHVTLLGGGFGRKSQSDYAQEAVIVSKALGGVPVKVTWTREDDIQHSFYHTVCFNRLEAALDKDGKVTGWLHRTVAPSLLSTFMPDPKHEHPLELAMGVVDMPFAIPNIRCENGEAEAHTRIGWFRSVSNIPHAFAVQSFVAEIAHELGRDPKDYLLELIGPARKIDITKSGVIDAFWNYGDPYETYPIDTGRLSNVLKVAAEAIGWGREMPKGHGLGIAVHRSFLTYVATALEVAIDDQGNLTIPRVDTAIDCGFAVNHERIQSQIEGAAVMGMSSTMFSQITFEKGRAVQGNYDTFEVAHMDTSPLNVRTHIIPHGYDVPASGVGEPGVPPFAPALCNAIFAATGKRIRTLPIGRQDLRPA